MANKFSKSKLLVSLEKELEKEDKRHQKDLENYERERSEWVNTVVNKFKKAVERYAKTGRFDQYRWSPPNKPNTQYSRRKSIKEAINQLNLIEGDTVTITHALRGVFKLVG